MGKFRSVARLERPGRRKNGWRSGWRECPGADVPATSRSDDDGVKQPFRSVGWLRTTTRPGALGGTRVGRFSRALMRPAAGRKVPAAGRPSLCRSRRPGRRSPRPCRATRSSPGSQTDHPAPSSVCPAHLNGESVDTFRLKQHVTTSISSHFSNDFGRFRACDGFAELGVLKVRRPPAPARPGEL